MEISNSGSTVTITGNIKSIGDLQQIKSSLDDLTIENKSITLKIINSISITSSVIGYFTKLIYKNNIHISMQVGDIRLYELLDELSLVSQFNVRTI
jgi:hypothetical protein